MIPHHSMIANIIQIAHRTQAKDESRPLDLQRFKPGSRVLAGELNLDADPPPGG